MSEKNTELILVAGLVKHEVPTQDGTTVFHELVQGYESYLFI
jgi:hypothetical protein